MIHTLHFYILKHSINIYKFTFSFSSQIDIIGIPNDRALSALLELEFTSSATR